MKIHSNTSRIRAALLNSGRYNVAGAEAKLASMRLEVHLSADSASTPAGQAAALTAVLVGTRCFAEVVLTGATDVPMIWKLPVAGRTVGEVSVEFGAVLELSSKPSRIVIVGADPSTDRRAIRAIWNGWAAGIAPAADAPTFGRSDCALAGLAAGALAVGHCFLAEQDDPRAGRTRQGISLWAPDAGDRWFEEAGPAYGEVYLPRDLWLIGLGNLGQAYLWSLTWLPYEDPKDLMLFLQDDDTVREENWGTSVLVKKGRYGPLKTRIGEEWSDARGFQVRRIDRRLDKHQKRGEREPSVALAGLDRIAPRKLLGLPGYDYIIDGGLGADAHDYHRIRVNVFDKDHSPASHFEGVEDDTTARISAIRRLAAYVEHEAESTDGGCGTAEMAGIPVAVPFVGVFAGALAVTQAVRLASGLAPHESSCGALDDLRSWRSHEAEARGHTAIAYVAAGLNWAA